MPTDTEQVRAAIERAAQQEGFLDLDALRLPVFADAIALAKIENGVVVGVGAAITAMKTAKPNFFVLPDFSTMGDKEFAEREADVKARSREIVAERVAQRTISPRRYSALDSARLTEPELDALSVVLGGARSCSLEHAVLEEAAARLDVTLTDGAA